MGHSAKTLGLSFGLVAITACSASSDSIDLANDPENYLSIYHVDNDDYESYSVDDARGDTGSYIDLIAA